MTSLFNPAAYAFNWFAVPVSVVGLVVLAIGFFILKENRRSASNLSFFLLCVSVFIWLTGFGWVYLITDSHLALSVYRSYTFLGVSLIAFSIYLFSVMWLRFWHSQKMFVILGFVISSFYYLSALTTSHVVSHMERYYWGFYSRYDRLGTSFVVFFIAYFLAGFFNFAYRLKHPIAGVTKSQIKAIIIVFCVALTACVDFLPKLFHLELYPFGYLSAFCWILVMAYSIVKYQVMDIQTVIHKTILWVVTSVIFVAPAGIGLYFARPWLTVMPPVLFAGAVCSVLLAFIPYVRFVQPRIDHLFQRRRWDLNRVFEYFAEDLVHLKTLEDLAKHILQTISRTLYPKDLFLLLWDEDHSECLIFEGAGHALKIQTKDHDDFFKFLDGHGALIHADYVTIDPRLLPIQRQAAAYFRQMKTCICVPLVLDQRLIGVINVGRKTNLKPYSAAEMRFLTDLRGSAVIAISNSLRLIAMQASLRKWNEELEKKVEQRTGELKNAQAQLIQAEKLATIGTLAGGVAHEINNPLAAILTNAQMLLMDNLDSETKESVKLIEEAAGRCRTIVQKLMKYSRKPVTADKNETVNLPEVITHTLSFLKYQLDQENIRIVSSLSDAVFVSGNANELSQVFTNLILNARDALCDRKTGAEIHIQMKEKPNSVMIKISDNGKGISKEHLQKIFDPFFTTKDVGKGTGLGLSIVQGIIRKCSGSIGAESEIGRGTTMTAVFQKAPDGTAGKNKRKKGRDTGIMACVI